jgi:hypothetical protein
MLAEKLQSELTRLRKEQNKTRHNEVFGGLSSAEQAEYNAKAERIHELEGKIRASAVAKSLQSAKTEQSRQWN